jgi:hypothetical protein
MIGIKDFYFLSLHEELNMVLMSYEVDGRLLKKKIKKEKKCNYFKYLEKIFS